MRLLREFEKAAADLLQALEPGDRVDLQQSMNTLSERWQVGESDW